MTSNRVCRICLQTGVFLGDLSDKAEEALKEIFNIDVQLGEGPFRLCVACDKDLESFHKFYLKVRANQVVYKETLEKVNEKDVSDGSDFDDVPDMEIKDEPFEDPAPVPEIKPKEVTKKHSNKKTHLCTICGRSYSNASYLRKHIAQHDLPSRKKGGKPLLTCDLCGLQKYDYAKLRNHIETVHLKIKDATCHICGAYFHRTTIRAHLKKMHRDNKKREKCEECGKYFLDVKQHIARNHNEQEAVFCHICKKPFKNRMLLSSHRFKRHPPDGKYDCRECDKKFTNPIGLKEHKASHHQGVFLYNCEFCDYRGNYKKNLFDHYKRNHREYYDQRRQVFLARHDTEVPPKVEQI